MEINLLTVPSIFTNKICIYIYLPMVEGLIWYNICFRQKLISTKRCALQFKSPWDHLCDKQYIFTKWLKFQNCWSFVIFYGFFKWFISLVFLLYFMFSAIFCDIQNYFHYEKSYPRQNTVHLFIFLVLYWEWQSTKK